MMERLVEIALDRLNQRDEAQSPMLQAHAVVRAVLEDLRYPPSELFETWLSWEGCDPRGSWKAGMSRILETDTGARLKGAK
jgi:hypothetical protein